MSELLILMGIGKQYHKYIFAVLILVIGWYLIKFIIRITNKALIRAHVDEGMISFTKSFLQMSLRVVLIIMVFITLGIVEMSSLVTALSALTVTVGITMKSSLSNFAGGFLIITNKTFSVGDRIKIKDDEGIVSRIEIMFTTLVTDEGDEIIIPNACLVESHIKNYSRKRACENEV